MHHKLTHLEKLVLKNAVETDLARRSSSAESLARMGYLKAFVYRQTVYYNPTRKAQRLYDTLFLPDNENNCSRMKKGSMMSELQRIKEQIDDRRRTLEGIDEARRDREEAEQEEARALETKLLRDENKQLRRALDGLVWKLTANVEGLKEIHDKLIFHTSQRGGRLNVEALIGFAGMVTDMELSGRIAASAGPTITIPGATEITEAADEADIYIPTPVAESDDAAIFIPGEVS